MKTNQISYVLTLLVAVFLVTFLSGCDNDLSVLNEDPNNISTASLKTAVGQQALVIGIQSVVGDWYAGDRSRLLSIWTRQMCAPSGLGRPQPTSWNNYLMDRGQDSPNSYIWQMAYDVVKLSNDVINNAGSAGLSGPQVNLYVGMAKFYKALALGELAALYGSIPVETDATEPPFVSQTAAYTRVQTLLDEALASFNAGTAADAKDLNFSGDQASWVAACHSLKARYLLHTLDYAGALTQAQQGITAAAGTVNAYWSTNVLEYSPWGHWVNTETGNPIRANKYLIDKLTSEAGDTRLNTFFTPGGSATTIVGFDIYGDLGGAGDELVADNAAGLNKYGPVDAPFPLMSYEETVLIRAEAQARTAGAAAAVPDIDIIRTGAGLAGVSGAATTDAAACITEILKQKYMQLLLEGQAYHDMRRVHKTDGTPLYRTGIPLRWLYPDVEQKVNPNTPVDDASTVNELW
ncbi:MAG: RagB/SusD family nutrient uptake outer membrane protein [Bacteroidetes bacterium]|nr:RagB/SusD family nutrient uptake outer membrane protein [Bacteroidota bacterium]